KALDWKRAGAGENDAHTPDLGLLLSACRRGGQQRRRSRRATEMRQKYTALHRRLPGLDWHRAPTSSLRHHATAAAPAIATCASCCDAAPDTPIPPTILPSAVIGTPPSATDAPNVNTRRPTPPPATASSSAFVGRRNSTAVRALASAIRTDESWALSSRCSITTFPPQS